MNVTDLNQALPERLRIDDAPNLTGILDQAEAAGWTTDTIAAHLTRKCGPGAGTGAVIWQLRNLPTPPTHFPTPTTTGYVINPHPYTQDPNQPPGWCSCQLPRNNRHHTTGEPNAKAPW